MQVKFRDLASSAKKFTDAGSARAGDYAKNAVAAANDWAANTSASADNYTKGVQDGIQRGAFLKGVNAAGPGKYASQVNAVGQVRFSDGISKAGPSWQKGFGAIAQKVAGTDIGPRGIKGSAQNKQRASAMADAFRAAKLAAA